MLNEIHCPKCGSTQLTANKKGFSGKKAVVGGLLAGGIGLLAGTIGSNKIIITCLACGNEFRAGQTESTKQPVKQHSAGSYKAMRIVSWIILIVFLIIGGFALNEQTWGFFAFCLFMCFFGIIGIKGASENLKKLKQ